MNRPDQFQLRYHTTRRTPFQALDSTVEKPDGAGVRAHNLASGQLVWMEEPLPKHPGGRTALGYVEGLGLVLLDHRSLERES